MYATVFFVDILYSFFVGPWSNAWFLGNTLDSIGLLMSASLGAAIAFRSGCFNLGIEGQLYIGGVAASAIMLWGDSHELNLTVLGACAALGVGGFLGALSGILKRYCHANEIISTFLLSSALVPVADYVIMYSLRTPHADLLASAPFEHRLKSFLPPSHLSLSFVFTVLIVLTLALWTSHSRPGYRIRIAGQDPRFAQYGGIDARQYWIPALALSGALSALTGFFAVAGTYGRCHVGFSGGIGWSAIAISLAAQNIPLALIPVSGVYGALLSGSNAASLATGMDIESSSLIQAIVLFCATVRIRRSRYA
ncbi:ABC transporter permease [Pillotina sp. SPG140]